MFLYIWHLQCLALLPKGTNMNKTMSVFIYLFNPNAGGGEQREEIEMFRSSANAYIIMNMHKWWLTFKQSMMLWVILLLYKIIVQDQWNEILHSTHAWDWYVNLISIWFQNYKFLWFRFQLWFHLNHLKLWPRKSL